MSDALAEAQRLYVESLDAQRDQRRQISEDLEFSDPSDPRQWDETIRIARENDPGGKRPCLVMDQIGQYVANVAGQIEQNPPALHAIPEGGGAEKEAAEQMDGRFRYIEYSSRASQHYARALTSAARAGVGYLTVRPKYIDRALNIQEPSIGSEPDPLRVVLDPWSVETDGCDADFGYILTPFSVREFNRRWKGKDARDFGDVEYTRYNDQRKSVLVAEQWVKEQSTKNMIVFVGADGQDTTLEEGAFWEAHQAGEVPEQAQAPHTYKDKTQIIKWRQMSGADVLEESEYLADSIGIVPMYGYVGFANGRMTYCGLPRRGRNPQRAYNYHVSEQLAFIMTAPKSPWLVSKRAARGVEALWDNSAREARAWLPYNDVDEEGQPIQTPTRINSGTNLVNHETGAAQALRDIQAATGMYQSNLGANSNVVSGVAYDAQKQQGEASTAHFPSHMAASLGQLGRIVMQMDARLADTPRKQAIIGVDGSPGSINVDPEQKTAFQRQQGGDVSINPKVGTYGVRVVVGASFATQRKETNAAFAEIMRGNKELAPVVAPFWAQTLDFPGSDKFAQAMAAMAPPPVKSILQPEGQDKGPDPAEMAQQLAQCKEALAEAIQHAKDAQDDADQAIAAAADAKRLGEVRERELDIDAYNAETNRLKVTGANEAQIQAVVTDLVNTMLSQPEPLPGDPVPQQAAPVEAPPEMPTEPEQPMDGGLQPDMGQPTPDSQQPAPETAPLA